jgi:hypothetical protein
LVLAPLLLVNTSTLAIVLAAVTSVVSFADPQATTVRSPPGESAWSRADASVALRESCVVRTRTEARHRGGGYDHLVHLDSFCAFTMSCSVTTDAAPMSMQVALGAGRRAELLTHRNSRSRMFTATVSCQPAE